MKLVSDTVIAPDDGSSSSMKTADTKSCSIEAQKGKQNSYSILYEFIHSIRTRLTIDLAGYCLNECYTLRPGLHWKPLEK